MRKNLLLIGSFVAASLAAAVPADAQIYSWRDDAGTLVLSNKPREGTAPVLSYAVPKTDASGQRDPRQPARGASTTR